jgi:hypothetical protein
MMKIVMSATAAATAAGGRTVPSSWATVGVTAVGMATESVIAATTVDLLHIHFMELTDGLFAQTELIDFCLFHVSDF